MYVHFFQTIALQVRKKIEQLEEIFCWLAINLSKELENTLWALHGEALSRKHIYTRPSLAEA